MTAKKKQTESPGKSAAQTKSSAKSKAKKTAKPPSANGKSKADLFKDNTDKMPVIVGIGASAGGLEAFEHFFTNMPPDSGIAFVLIQHLDPTHESMLTDLVGRYTRMPVVQVADGTRVQANQVYIIPPNRDMALLHGALNLIEPVSPRGMRQPIDYFFRSLAQDQGEKAICIILSGTGTDGTLGMKEIKGQGGMAMVQEPDSAKYDGMPKSAINTGLADFILPPGKMPEQLISFVKHAVLPGKKKENKTPPAGLLQKIFVILRNHTGNDFSYYKNNTIVRRIDRRIAVNQIADLAQYVKYLQQNPLEVNILFKDLLIGVTNFFRDKEAFKSLERKVIPEIVKSKKPNNFLRVWVPGCATGEEAYSIAMLISERLKKEKKNLKVQIFATDIDQDAIETARGGGLS